MCCADEFRHELSRVLAHEIERVAIGRAEVAPLLAHAVDVHAKPVGVLLEVLTGQQLARGVDLALHVHAEFDRSLDDLFALRRFEERQQVVFPLPHVEAEQIDITVLRHLHPVQAEVTWGQDDATILRCAHYGFLAS